MRFDDGLRDRVTEHVRAFQRQEASAAEGLRHAAVAVALVGDAQGRACFLLTRRAKGLRSHGGQWALPGGRVDGGETATQAALRELEEEVGLSLAPDAVLGLLDDYQTRSGYRMTPVVAWGGPDPDLVANPAEVKDVYRIPLGEIDVDPELASIPQSDRPVIRLPLFGRYIHAPTAAILHQVREVALHGRDTRVAHFEQPLFAWR